MTAGPTKRLWIRVVDTLSLAPSPEKLGGRGHHRKALGSANIELPPDSGTAHCLGSGTSRRMGIIVSGVGDRNIESFNYQPYP